MFSLRLLLLLQDYNVITCAQKSARAHKKLTCYCCYHYCHWRSAIGRFGNCTELLVVCMIYEINEAYEIIIDIDDRVHYDEDEGEERGDGEALMAEFSEFR